MKKFLYHACDLKFLRKVAKNRSKEKPEKVMKSTHIAKHHQAVIDDAFLDLNFGRESEGNREIGYQLDIWLIAWLQVQIMHFIILSEAKWIERVILEL